MLNITDPKKLIKLYLCCEGKPIIAGIKVLILIIPVTAYYFFGISFTALCLWPKVISESAKAIYKYQKIGWNLKVSLIINNN